MRLSLVPDETRDALLARARTTVEVATALASTARGAAPALLKELPHLAGAVAGSAWTVGSALVHKALPGDRFSPGMAEHQASDVETLRDAGLPTPAEPATPPAEPSEDALGVGAPGSAASAVDKAALQAAATDSFTSGALLSHDELPLADFDHLTIGALRNKIRSLDVMQLVQLREWERTHADRLPVVTALENRIAKLQADSADSGTPGTTTPTG